jgi:predicted NAD/FAD-binding protein
MSNKPRLAVVGAGVSGLVAAWLLSDSHEVTLFEAGNYLGGHTNTVDVHLEGMTHPVDTGFLVFNEKTYPNLIGMFDLLGVDSVETEMSFAVSLQNPDIEWAGSSLATLFGQKRNLARPRFWAMLADILRFNRASGAVLAATLRQKIRPASDCPENIQRIAEVNEPKTLLKRLDALERTRRMLSAGVQEALALESGFLQMIAHP